MSTDTLNLIEKARDILSAAGLVLDGPPDVSGALVRCGTAQRPKGTDGAYKVHLDFPPSVWACNYHEGGQGETFPLWEKGQLDAMTEAEREALRERIRRERKQAAQELAKRHRAAAERANQLFRPLPHAGENNAYLNRKGVSPMGDMRQDKEGGLVLPLRNESGAIVSLQFIAGEGEKRFLSGGEKKGCYFPIPARNGRQDGPLLIGEGVATVLSACMATGRAGLVAFDAGNLLPVAEMARSKYPEREIVLLADNDCASTRADGTPWNPGHEAAQKAAQAVGAKLALCPAHEGRPTDFNDLHQWRGLDAVRLCIEEAGEASALLALPDEWPGLIHFAAHDLPKLEAQYLPPILAEYCAALAEEKQVPLELPTAISLAVLATAAQGRYMVQVREGYREPLNLYVLCPLDPANRKSAVVEACIEPLRNWEKRMGEIMGPMVRKVRSERLTMEKAIEAKRAKAARAVDLEQLQEVQKEVLELEKQLPDVPAIPRLLADNVTMEGLAPLMESMGGNIAIITAEGGIFDIMGGLYNKGTPNLDLVLKAHSGDSFRVDRKMSVPVMLESPRLTFAISPQPVTLASRDASRAFRGRGLDARFLYFMPESTLGWRKLEPAPMDPAIRERFGTMVQGLLPAQWEKEVPAPVTLELSKEAYQLWLAFAGEVEKGLAPGGEFEGMNDWGGKLAGAVARMAGLFHLAEHERPEQARISPETMRRAVYMGSLLTGHARAAYSLMGTDDALEGAKSVLEWIRRKAADRFCVRDCFNELRGQVLFAHVEGVKTALKELEERGFIRELPVEKRGPGRAPSPIYLVNPASLKG